MTHRLVSFCASGFTVQAPHARGVLGVAAILALSGGTPQDESRRRPVALEPAAYAMLVSQVQDAVDREVGRDRISVLDRSADPGSEAERLSARAILRPAGAIETLGDAPGAYNARIDLAGDEGNVHPWKRPYEIEPGTVCIVGGAQPGAVGAEAIGGPPDALPTAGAQRWALLREVGHCLIGPSRAAAEAFAALVSYRDGDADLVEGVALLPDEDGAEPGARGRALAAARTHAALAAERSMAGLAAIAERIADPGVAAVAALSSDADFDLPQAPSRQPAPSAAPSATSAAGRNLPRGAVVVPASVQDEDETPSGPRR